MLISTGINRQNTAVKKYHWWQYRNNLKLLCIFKILRKNPWAVTLNGVFTEKYLGHPMTQKINVCCEINIYIIWHSVYILIFALLGFYHIFCLLNVVYDENSLVIHWQLRILWIIAEMTTILKFLYFIKATNKKIIASSFSVKFWPITLLDHFVLSSINFLIERNW